MGSLSLFWWNFPTQESNRDLQNCKWILSQLSYQGSPEVDPKLMLEGLVFLK
jgi:hypothetical protein